VKIFAKINNFCKTKFCEISRKSAHFCMIFAKMKKCIFVLTLVLLYFFWHGKKWQIKLLTCYKLEHRLFPLHQLSKRLRFISRIRIRILIRIRIRIWFFFRGRIRIRIRIKRIRIRNTANENILASGVYLVPQVTSNVGAGGSKLEKSLNNT
jgi:hypothetical protein